MGFLGICSNTNWSRESTIGFLAIWNDAGYTRESTMVSWTSVLPRLDREAAMGLYVFMYVCVYFIANNITLTAQWNSKILDQHRLTGVK